MTVQAFLILTSAQRDAVVAINPSSPGKVDPRAIDNPLANNLGEGTLLGRYILPARLLVDPDYTAFYNYCSTLPIRTLDSVVIFLPDPEI